MITYGKQTINQSDIDSVVETIKSEWLTQGPMLETFESNLKKYLGADYCSVVSNGTAALHLVSLALEWEKSDLIITTPNTFLATANCIVYAKASPIFVDINTKDKTLDPALVEEKIKYYQRKGKKIKAVIAVDYAGHPSDWKSLRSLADKYNFVLINDNCHALGASYFEDRQYAIKYADIVIQSFHPTKQITTGEGGAVLTNNKDIDTKIKCFRSHGMTKDPSQLIKNDGPWYYEMHEVGFNYRITDFQCALGNSQLKRLDELVNKRRSVSKLYNDFFSSFDSLIIPTEESYVRHAYHLYPLEINFKKLKIKKLSFYNKMKEGGITLQVHYLPVHLQPFYVKNFGYSIGDFPIAEGFSNNEFSLPIYPELSSDNINRVIENIIKIISG